MMNACNQPDRDFNPREGEFVQVMNQFVDKLIRYRLDSNEWSVLMLVIRRTWGVEGRAWAGIKWKTIREQTELGQSSLIYAMRKLKTRNIIHTCKEGRCTKYKINSKVSTWIEPEDLKDFRNSGNHGSGHCSDLNGSLQRGHSSDLNNAILTEVQVTPVTQVRSLQRPNEGHSSDLNINIKNTISKTIFKNTPLPPKGGTGSPTGGNGSKPKKQGRLPPPSGSELKQEHPWLDVTAWDEFVEHRQDIKRPLTKLAIKKAVNFLHDHQHEQQAVIDQTIINTWRGLFPVRSGFSAKSLNERKTEKWRQRYDERYR